MPIYDITQIPVQVSDEKARELVASLGLNLTAPPEISGVGITISVQEELSPAQLTDAQNSIRNAVLASIGTIERRA
jgi:hypothetical protein